MATTRAPLTKLAAPAPVVCWGRADEAARVMLPLAMDMEAVWDPLIIAELMALAAMEVAADIMEVPEAAAAAEERG
jgi:hypothetical protein